ncbi:hypothetical protein [Branchiibius hedensis]|uniref:hypothetical protein n=1 Tax=Branchiibius hedensis TaxID=672460 RepID=UPI000D6B88A4|nr:hypothetical protein [Branchiibius hedensis]
MLWAVGAVAFDDNGDWQVQLRIADEIAYLDNDQVIRMIQGLLHANNTFHETRLQDVALRRPASTCG